MSEKLDPEALAARVQPALGVIDAILKGTMLPEPSAEESQDLGLADYDPELRYRVAKDVIEQAYGKPKQQVELEGGFVPDIMFLPAFVSRDEPQAQITAGPVEDPPDVVDVEEESTDADQ